MMKADVLSGFKTLKVCIAYNYKGKEISHFPFNIEPENVTPIYKSFKGWQEDISSGDNFEKLPQTLKDYVAFIEESVGVKISIVSVGPDRTETILR